MAGVRLRGGKGIDGGFCHSLAVMFDEGVGGVGGGLFIGFRGTIDNGKGDFLNACYC